MPLRLAERTATLEGVVGVDDAEALAAWVRATPSPRVNLRACTHLHTAVLQVLLAAAVRVSAAPEDPFLAAWVVPALEARAAAAAAA
jgi:hypothetical protein